MPLTDFQLDFCKKLPLQPSEELIAHAKKEGLLDTGHTIIYKADWYRDPLTDMKEKCCRCFCSACKGYYRMPREEHVTCNYETDIFGIYINDKSLFSDDFMTCPKCGQKTKLQHCSHISRYGTYLSSETIAEFKVIDGVLVFISFSFNRIGYPSGEFRENFNLKEAYAFRGKRSYKFVGYYKYFSTVKLLDHWEARCDSTDTMFVLYPFRILPPLDDIFTATGFENCKFDRYIKESKKDYFFPVTYLRIFQQHPQVENLIMQGLTYLLNELIYKESNKSYYNSNVAKIPTEGIYWKYKKPFQMLGFLNRQDYNDAIRKKMSLDDIILYGLAVNHGVSPDVYKFHKLESAVGGMYRVKDLLNHGVDPEYAVLYIRKQNKKIKGKKKVSVSDLLDYWRMAKEENWTLEKKEEKFPVNLQNAHDALIQLREERRRERWERERAEAEKKRQEKVKEKSQSFKTLAERYSWLSFSDKDLFIRIAEDPIELIKEHTELHHCVDTYITSHSEGDACIFFIRKTAEPDKSFFTLELDMKKFKVLQNRGLRNCARTPEVEAFEKKWLDYIRNLQIRKGA